MSSDRRRFRARPSRRAVQRHRLMRSETLENRLLLASDWQNAAAPLDVNHDQHISSADALSVINDINRNGVRELISAEAEGGGRPRMSVDVNGDSSASPSDVLAVINYLNGEGENGAFIQYRLAIFDADGVEEITTVGLGEEFVVKVFVSDIRMSGRAGVFSAYLDINYESDLASIVPSAFRQLDLVTFEEVDVTIMDNQTDYGQGRSGDALSTPGVIDGVGSFAASLAPLGPAERELLKFKARATAEGTVTFVGSSTTEATGDEGQSPTLDTGLYNTDNPVCPSEAVDPETGGMLCRGEMMFVNASVQIVSDLVANPDTLVVDEDSGTSDPFDVLENDVANIGVLTFSSFTEASNGQVASNGDGTFTYTPNANFNGQDSFTYTINNGEGAERTADVTITVNAVNDGPVNTVPGPQSTDEDTALSVDGVSVSDIDADDGGGLTVTLGVVNGVLNVGSTSGTVTGAGSSDVTIAGSVAAVNDALSGLSYSPNLNFNGADTLSVSTNDGGNTGSGGSLVDTDTVSITVNPINDAPVNTVPGSQTVFNTETLVFGSGQIRVDDVDAVDLQVDLSVNEGTLSLGSTSGLEVSGNGTGSVSFTGSVSSVNAGLDGLVYDPADGLIGSDTLTMTSNDLGGTGAGGPLTDTDTIQLTITPPEVPFAAPDAVEIEEDNSGVTINVLENDLRPEPIANNTLSITQVNGQSTPALDTSVSTGGGGTLTYNGDTFTYVPAANFFGTDTFTYTIESTPDAGDGPSTGTVTIEVLPINDGPVNLVPGGQTIDEDTTLTFVAPGVAISDIDSGDNALNVTLSVNNGTLSVSSSGGGTVSGGGTGNVELSGTVSEINGRLGGLSYTPTSNYFGQDTLTITTDDNGHTGGVAGDPAANNPLTDTSTVNITVTPINDAPTIVVPGAQSFITDFDNVLSPENGNAISIDDVDAGNADVQLSLSIGVGTITLLDDSGLTSVNGNGTGDVDLRGSVDSINSALAAGVNYVTSATGNVQLSAIVNDLGNTGGGDLTADGNVDIEVLDFVPSNIGGWVFVDSNANGKMDDTPTHVERGLEGAEVTLRGFDAITGREIEPITVRTSSDGSYMFANVRPGTYTIGKERLPHYVDGPAQFESPIVADSNNRGSVEIGVRDSLNSMDNYFPVLGLNAHFSDTLNHQTPFNPADGELYNNILFAVDATDPNDPLTVVAYNGAWNGYSGARVVVASDGMSAQLTVRTAGGQEMTQTVTFESGRLRIRSFGAMSTIRIFLDPAALNAVNGTEDFAAAVDQILEAE